MISCARLFDRSARAICRIPARPCSAVVTILACICDILVLIKCPIGKSRMFDEPIYRLSAELGLISGDEVAASQTAYILTGMQCPFDIRCNGRPMISKLYHTSSNAPCQPCCRRAMQRPGCQDGLPAQDGVKTRWLHSDNYLSAKSVTGSRAGYACGSKARRCFLIGLCQCFGDGWVVVYSGGGWIGP